MAASGFTPIQLYRTTTASAVPVAGNLAAGELAINLTDKKLYAKDASNNVFVLADASSGGTTATNLAGGAAGSLPYQSGANTTTFQAIGTAGQVLQVNAGATAPEWVSSSGTGNVARVTSPTFVTPVLGAATATSINGLTLTSSTGALTIANGKTLTANSTLTLAGVDAKTLTVNNSLTLAGTDATVMTFPTTSATIARTDAGQTFTGTNTFSSAPQISTLTSTRVVYAGASGVLQDSANLTFDGTSLTMGGNPTLSAGTANGVLYLNGSKVATSGSALTFDGSLLKTSGALSIQGIAFPAAGSGIELFWDGTQSVLQSYNRTSPAYIPLWLESSYTRFGINGSEQMSLTSTGLGIGTTPGFKLDVNGTTRLLGAVGVGTQPGTYGGQVDIYTNTNSANDGIWVRNDSAGSSSIAGIVLNASGNSWRMAMGSTANNSNALFWAVDAGGANATRMTLDTSGNLGLGVTPSGWFSGFKALDISSAAAISGSGNGAIIWGNGYLDGSVVERYKNNGYAVRYTVASDVGQHIWYTAPSGNAGDPISFTQAMTLLANGNLLVGTTSSATRVTLNLTSAYDGVTLRTTNEGPIGLVGMVNPGTNNDVAIGTLGVNNLRFFTDGTANERVRIKSTGQLRFIPLAADPSGAEAGDVYYNSGTNKLRLYDGSTWVDLN